MSPRIILITKKKYASQPTEIRQYTVERLEINPSAIYASLSNNKLCTSPILHYLTDHLEMALLRPLITTAICERKRN